MRVGVRRVFWTCIVLLEAAYAGAIGMGFLSEVKLLASITVVTADTAVSLASLSECKLTGVRNNT